MAKNCNGFQFKQFFIAHDQCAMKVTTDAILLGCWVNTDSSIRTMLDIGTGSGILALMLAQKTAENVSIDAVELEDNAFQQAEINFAASKWGNKLQAIHSNILDYADKMSHCYDVIVTNPPYFNVGVACASSERSLARYTGHLTHEQLLCAAKKLLSERGKLYLVLPTSVVDDFLVLANENQWYLGQRLFVRERANKAAHLLLLEMALYPLDSDERGLTIRQEDNQYSADYRELAREFYLAF